MTQSAQKGRKRLSKVSFSIFGCILITRFCLGRAVAKRLQMGISLAHLDVRRSALARSLGQSLIITDFLGKISRSSWFGRCVAMREIAAFEAKNILGSLLNFVQQGVQVVVTSHGKPFARLVPETGFHDRAAAKTAVMRIRERALQKKGNGISPEEWQEFRDAGRP
jgi:prevent-host-death family protein